MSSRGSAGTANNHPEGGRYAVQLRRVDTFGNTEYIEGMGGFFRAASSTRAARCPPAGERTRCLLMRLTNLLVRAARLSATGRAIRRGPKATAKHGVRIAVMACGSLSGAPGAARVFRA